MSGKADVLQECRLMLVTVRFPLLLTVDPSTLRSALVALVQF